MYSNSGICENCPAGSDCTSGSPTAVSSGSYSPLGYTETLSCPPEAVCDTSGPPYESCDPGKHLDTGSSACVDCTDPDKYCPDGIYEMEVPLEGVGGSSTFTFALEGNQWWDGSAYSTSTQSNAIFSPLLYRGSKVSST